MTSKHTEEIHVASLKQLEQNDIITSLQESLRVVEANLTEVQMGHFHLV